MLTPTGWGQTPSRVCDEASPVGCPVGAWPAAWAGETSHSPATKLAQLCSSLVSGSDPSAAASAEPAALEVRLEEVRRAGRGHRGGSRDLQRQRRRRDDL